VEYFKESELEIVVLLEGVDPVTANTLQARHSYTAEDVVWGQRPVQCVFRAPNDNPASTKSGCMVDYSKFHDYEEDDSPNSEFYPAQSL
jgi:hypothetical protein